MLVLPEGALAFRPMKTKNGLQSRIFLSVPDTSNCNRHSAEKPGRSRAFRFLPQASLKAFRRNHTPSTRYTLRQECHARDLLPASRYGLVLHTWDSRLTSTCPSLSYGRLFSQSWPWILISLLENCLCTRARTSVLNRGFNVAAKVHPARAALWFQCGFHSFRE